jgi:hypothetical protein
MAAISKTTQKVTKQLKCEPEEEEELQMAIEKFSKIAQKGKEKDTGKAKQELEKAVKTLKKVKMKDLEKAMEKAGATPKQKR